MAPPLSPSLLLRISFLTTLGILLLQCCAFAQTFPGAPSPTSTPIPPTATPALPPPGISQLSVPEENTDSPRDKKAVPTTRHGDPMTPGDPAGLESFLEDAAQGGEFGEHYNLKLGPVTFQLSAGVEFQYNDNINLAETNREEDFILTPNIGLTASWNISSLNTLRLAVSMGYSKYMLHPELDGSSFNVSPDSELSLDMLIGDARVTVFDRFGYLVDPADLVDLSGVAQFGRFVNELGFYGQYPLNDLILNGSYSHTSFIVVQSGFSDYSNEADQASIGAELVLDTTTNVGLNIFGRNIRYASSAQGSGWTYRVGPYFNSRLTPYIEVGAGAGIEFNDFSGGGSGATYYYNGNITHRLSDYLTHSLLVSRGSEAGLTSSISENTHVEYQVLWRMNSMLTWSIAAYGDFVKESGGISPEDAGLYGISVATSLQLNEKLNANFGYRYATKDSDLKGNNYYQNRVVVGLTYSF